MDASRCIQVICMRAHLFNDCKFGMPSIKFLAWMIGLNITQVKPYFLNQAGKQVQHSGGDWYTPSDVVGWQQDLPGQVQVLPSSS